MTLMTPNDIVRARCVEFGKKLQMTRVAKGISQKKLSEMSGVAVSTIRVIEKATRAVKMDTLIRLLDALGYRLTFEMP